MIGRHAFRIEVLGTQVPDVIAERIFGIFASIVSVKRMKIGEQINQELQSTIGNSVGFTETPDMMDIRDLA